MVALENKVNLHNFVFKEIDPQIEINTLDHQVFILDHQEFYHHLIISFINIIILNLDHYQYKHHPIIRIEIKFIIIMKK